MAAPSNTKWGNTITGSKSNRKGKIGISATLTNTNTQSTVTVEVWFWSMYSISDTSNSYYYNANATSATTLIGSKSISHTVSTGEGWSTSNQTKLGSSTYTYTRGTSASKKNYAAKFTGIDNLGSGSMTVTTSVTVPALTSYTVSYNANGGSGAPSSQTKYYGTTLTLSSTKPTRTGYTFQGWATSASGSVSYAAGASYTGNAALTLYAIWKVDTYTVSYNANGGSGAPSAQTKTYGTNLTLSTTKPTRTNHTFKGWSTSANGAVVYASGATYSNNAAVTLYAVWEIAYVKPTITNFKVTRCNSSGTATEEGTYCKYECSWSLCTTAGTNTLSSINYWITSTSNGGSISGASSSTSGTVSGVYGSGYSIDTSYTVGIIVTDTKGGVTTVSAILPSAKFSIDFKSGGKGAAFGKGADTDNLLDVAWGLKVAGATTLNSTLTMGGQLNAYNVIPRTTNTYNLGSSSYYWNYLYSKYANISGDATVTGTLTIGATANAAEKVVSSGKYMSKATDVAYMHEHGTSGYIVGVGVGAGGYNRGVHDGTNGSWMIYRGNTGNDTMIPGALKVEGHSSKIGTVKSVSTDTSTAVTTCTAVASISIEQGTWILFGSAVFDTSVNTAWVHACLSATSGSADIYGANRIYISSKSYDAYVSCISAWSTSGATIYMNAWTNDSGVKCIKQRMRAIRIA